jgi:hypothetical protein
LPGKQHQHEAQARLQKRQRDGARDIKIHAQRLVDGDLQRGGGRPPQRQHHHETGCTKQEDQGRQTWQKRAQRRPLQMPPAGTGTETELVRKAEVFRRDIFQGFQAEAQGQWQVEEHMCKQDAAQPIEAEEPTKPSGLAVEFHQRQHHHNGRKRLWHGKERQQQAAARKRAEGQRTGGGNGNCKGQYRRQPGLQQRETENAPDVSVERELPALRGRKNEQRNKSGQGRRENGSRGEKRKAGHACHVIC